MNISKEALVQVCIGELEQKKRALFDELNSIRASAASEIKSSMGDKYETSREMMQQEEVKLANQLGIIEDQLIGLSRIDIEKSAEKVEVGSIVQTENAVIFISVSIGKVEFEDLEILAISPVAPLAKMLNGKTIGEEVVFNRIRHRIVHLK